MTIDEKLEWLVAHCKGSVTVQFNDHRDAYQTIEQWAAEINQNHPSDPVITPEVLAKMLAADRTVRIFAYTTSPVGNFTVYGAGLDEALDTTIEAAKEEMLPLTE